LTCELLGTLPNTVALDEPMGRKHFAVKADAPVAKPGFAARALDRAGARKASKSNVPSPDPARLQEVADRVERFVSDTRTSALTRGVVPTVSVDGAVVGSKVSDQKDENGLRRRLAQRGEIAVDKPLTDDFTLVIKQVGSFTAAVEVLSNRFPMYALVRNPLSLLLSWQDVPFPPREGHLPVAESFRPDLAKTLAGIDDRIDRQFYLLGWFFGEFERVLPAASVLRYEDIVASGGKCLEVVMSEAASLDRTLSNRNSQRPGGEDHTMLQEMGERLLGTEGPWWNYYTSESVTAVLAGIS
jgi:hypothetical protein